MTASYVETYDCRARSQGRGRGGSVVTPKCLHPFPVAAVNSFRFMPIRAPCKIAVYMFLAIWGEEATGLLAPRAPCGGKGFSSKALKHLPLIGTLFTLRTQAMHHGSLRSGTPRAGAAAAVYIYPFKRCPGPPGLVNTACLNIAPAAAVGGSPEVIKKEQETTTPTPHSQAPAYCIQPRISER